jgi:endo-1,4-beta-xylanase
MKPHHLFFFIFVTLLVACAPAQAKAPAAAPSDTPDGAKMQTNKPAPTPTLEGEALRSLARDRGIQIGTAVAAGTLRTDKRYAETLAQEFNSITPENAMKMGPLRPSRERYDFAAADAIVDFAQDHNMQVRGHALVWHQQLPSWLTEGTWARDELIEILREHIMTVVGRYRGRVAAWDVVNEAVANDCRLGDTFWMQGIGPEYIDMAFRWAHEADPDALLFYNDYGCEGLEPKSDAVYELAGDLLERQVPIHGVGLQMHIRVGQPHRPENVLANMERLGELGLEVHITEIDVSIYGDPSESMLDQQAKIYRDMMDACLSAPSCGAFVLWGFTDRHSWIPSHFPGWGSALILDESYQPKLAYAALGDVLANP